jgi:cobaltochelatase CobS
LKEKQMIKTIKELFGVGPAVNIDYPGATGPFVPAEESSYQFRDELVRRLLLWHGGIAGRNLLVQGPTGSGKSSLIEQFANRMGIAVYRVPCHGRSEFGDFTGQLVIKQDGSTEFVHGALPLAMKTGGVILFDEINFLPPSVSGALNTVLDGGPLLLPETGEVIEPHPSFRIAATGNAVDQGDDAALYRGTQRMNLAMLQRFLMAKVGYLSSMEEAVVLNKVAPRLPATLIQSLVKTAEDVRDAFQKGDIETVLSTRTMVKMSRILEARLPLVLKNPMDETKFALRFTLLDGVKVEDAKAIEGTLERRGIPDLGSAAVNAGPAVTPAASASSGRTLTNAVPVFVFVNLNRQGTGHAAHWGFIEESVNACAMFNGSIEPALQTRFSASKNKTEAFFAANEKQTNRGYTHRIEVVTKKGVAHTVFLEAFLAQLAVVIAAKRMNNSCGIKKADIGNDAATKLVDFAGSISVAAMVV